MSEARVVDRDAMPTEVLSLIERIEKVLHHEKCGVVFNALINMLAHMTLDTANSEQEVWATAERITINFNKAVAANLEQLRLEMQRPPSATDVIN
jgi:hypothetical protein